MDIIVQEDQRHQKILAQNNEMMAILQLVNNEKTEMQLTLMGAVLLVKWNQDGMLSTMEP